jgi:hypothetical protein
VVGRTGVLKKKLRKATNIMSTIHSTHFRSVTGYTRDELGPWIPSVLSSHVAFALHDYVHSIFSILNCCLYLFLLHVSLHPSMLSDPHAPSRQKTVKSMRVASRFSRAWSRRSKVVVS